MRKWDFYSSRQIKPKGWLERQLKIQAKGLSGNLDKVWRDVRDSAWIGGDAEGWERVPYWLDGFIPLAYLLDDEDMKSRVKKYIDAIIGYQREDGWICPCSEEEIDTYDTWAVQLISKVLVVYYECSGDERIPEVIYKTMKNYHALLSSGRIKIFAWGQHRWFEAFIALEFLAKRYGETWIGELAAILYEQGTDYCELVELWRAPMNKWDQDTHIVNIVMMLKSEAVSCDLLGMPYTDKAERLTAILRNYHGTPTGIFTGDECLGGLSPIRGTELCAVAEQMYSYEQLLAYSGDGKWAERLELIAFNSLPATISDDMWTHQYDQMSNQIACKKFSHKPIFGTNNGEAHLFGLEPNYGCCTANFNQAWPKLALSAFMRREGEIVAMIPLPSSLEDDSISVTINTEYPFKNRFSYEVSAKKDMIFKIRIPSFARDLKVNGEECDRVEYLSFALAAKDEGRIEVEFETTPELVDRPHDLKCVRCGSLVFSLPIPFETKMYEYIKKDVERKFPYCDYEYLPKGKWSYAYSSCDFVKEEREMADIPFSSKAPPVVIRAKVREIPWGYEEGYDSVCASVPQCRIPIGPEEEILLYPYGAAKLRMTELPLI